MGPDVICRVPALDAPLYHPSLPLSLISYASAAFTKSPSPERILKDLNCIPTMAEVAAGTYIAAEVVEHTVEAGYAAYIVSKPTLPLKVSFTRIATASGDPSEYVHGCLYLQE